MFERFDTPGALLGRASLHDDLGAARVTQGRTARGTRYQYCPVGHHWATVTPLNLDGTAPAAEELAKAALVHDVRIP